MSELICPHCKKPAAIDYFKLEDHQNPVAAWSCNDCKLILEFLDAR